MPHRRRETHDTAHARTPHTHGARRRRAAGHRSPHAHRVRLGLQRHPRRGPGLRQRQPQHPHRLLGRRRDEGRHRRRRRVERAVRRRRRGADRQRPAPAALAGFAAGSPPDLFYLAPEALAGYAANGSIAAYGDDLANKDDFYPSLVDNFTVDGSFYCAPKDFSTLALIINSDLWTAAGLTDADIPTTWDQLASVAQKLTADGRVGLAFGAEYQRVGAFMAQAAAGSSPTGRPRPTAPRTSRPSPTSRRT